MKRILVVGAVVAACTGLTGCGSSPEDEAQDKEIRQQILAKELSSQSQSPTYRVSKTVRMLYELEGEGVTSADITIKSPTGTTQQQGIAVPMVGETGLPGLLITYDRGSFVYISAQSKSGSGSLTCRITNPDSDEVISTNTSSGQFAITTCQGTAS